MHHQRISPWRAVAFGLAALVLAAAGLKLHQLLTAPVLGDGWLDSRWFVTAVIEAELLIGLWLLSGLLPRLAWRASLALFAWFMLFALVQAVSGRASCGCFGQVTINPWLTALFDVAVLFLLWCCRPARVDVELPWPRIMPQCLTLVLLWLLLGSAAATAVASHRPTRLGEVGQLLSDGRTVVLEPETWVGKPFPLLDWIDIDADLGDGQWAVILYRRGCARCDRMIDDYEAGSLDLGTRDIALLALDSFGDAPREIRDGLSVHGDLSEAYSWFTTVPWVVHLDYGHTLSAQRVYTTDPYRAFPESLRSESHE